MRVPLEVMRRVVTLKPVSEEPAPDQPAAPPPPDKTFNGWGAQRTTPSSADGTYSFSGLTNGRYRVHVSAKGFCHIARL